MAPAEDPPLAVEEEREARVASCGVTQAAVGEARGTRRDREEKERMDTLWYKNAVIYSLDVRTF